MTRGQRGRLVSQLLLTIAFASIASAAFLWVAAPRWPSPMFHDGTWDAVTALIGVGGVVVGLASMIRIYRSDPEPDQRAWRYRERD